MILRQFGFWRWVVDRTGGAKTNCFAKLEREMLKNSRREIKRGQKKAKKNASGLKIATWYLQYMST